MWTQLSFSTTLMCFTSSLNLGKAFRPRDHDLGQAPARQGCPYHRHLLSLRPQVSVQV